MSEKSSSPTVADVAREAKVSKATAARVLGGYGIASDSARRVVMEAADRLGYQPNDLARSMSTGRSGLVGVIVGDIENAFFSQAVRGISDTLRAADLNLIISNSSERLSEEVEMVSVLLRQRVAGLIVAPTDSRHVNHLKAALVAGTPVVTIDRHAPELAADAICGEDRESIGRVLSRLQGAGHRHVAYVTAMETRDGKLGRLEDIGISAVRERIAGFLEHMREAGVENPADLAFIGATGDDETTSVVTRILEHSPPITAILASDSLIGARVFRELSDRGLSLPQDMSLVSWFDADWSRVTSPRISVVDQPTYQFGQKAAERLIARLQGDASPPKLFVIPTPLLDRGTIGPAKTG
ncbi:LacI family transcriptional regulator [Sagittula marina]|uniref:LacI family transcriptional regulator n=1 Tax=Sagittula marina TaxID=943940 RepID=A0A7W6DWM7_9RHOB|nr:LacI family DNA-binding transcriptional regulator [Sagittula marina]MBB3988332.1 LacI family transcriptional regulator [Sagittula marina]